MIFSRDSKHLLYDVRSDNKGFTVIDGKRQKDEGRFAFSPDRRHVVKVVRSSNKWFVSVDRKEKKQYDRFYGPLFSSDSKHVVYTAESSNKWFVVVDGKEGNQYDDFYLMPSDLKMIVFDTSESLHYLAVKDSDIYLVEEKIK